jgi:hypothetical protein
VTIYVEHDPVRDQRKGDWVVKNGAGRGGRIISRHHRKKKAKNVGRREASKRNTDLHVQNSTSGRWKQGPGFGGV